MNLTAFSMAASRLLGTTGGNYTSWLTGTTRNAWSPTSTVQEVYYVFLVSSYSYYFQHFLLFLNLQFSCLLTYCLSLKPNMHMFLHYSYNICYWDPTQISFTERHTHSPAAVELAANGSLLHPSLRCEIMPFDYGSRLTQRCLGGYVSHSTSNRAANG